MVVSVVWSVGFVCGILCVTTRSGVRVYMIADMACECVLLCSCL